MMLLLLYLKSRMDRVVVVVDTKFSIITVMTVV